MKVPGVSIYQYFLPYFWDETNDWNVSVWANLGLTSDRKLPMVSEKRH
jgi:hypothetical protein